MPKVEDYAGYFKELAKKAGLPEEQAATVLEALNNDTIRNGFIPLPNYSSDLDSVKAKTKQEAINEAKAYYDNWYAKEGKPAYDRAVSLAEEYAKYKSIYGDLDDSNNGNNSTQGARMANPNHMTKDEVQRMVSEAIAATSSAYINAQKSSMSVMAKHLHEFNEPLDPDDLEKFASQHGYTDVKSAYEGYIAPRRQQKQQSEWEEKVKKAREDGAKEERSRLRVPHDYAPREYSNPFLKPRDKDDDPNAGRNAFLEAFDEEANK